jgi:hypothetical protein
MSAGSPCTNDTCAREARSARSRCNYDSVASAIHPDDLTRCAHEFRDKEGDVAAPRPDVEHAHPARYTRGH